MSGALGWLLQRASGALLVLGMALHFYMMHLGGSDNIAYEAVRARLDNPYWAAFNAAFLGSVVYHGFNGLWGMAVEYLSGGALAAARALVAVSASALFAAGLYIIIAI